MEESLGEDAGRRQSVASQGGASGEVNPDNAMILDFILQNLIYLENKSLLFKPPVCGVLLWQP